MLKKCLFILMIILCGSFSIIVGQNKATILIKSATSSLSIKGNTNINKFTCKFNTAVLKDNIFVEYSSKENSIDFKNAKLILKNDCFDCGKKMITKDFRELIKSENYPVIELTLVTLNYSKAQDDIVYALVDFDIAGVLKRYKIPVIIEANNTIKASGDLNLDIREFNLENPKKAFGLIKIDDVVTISFELELEKV